MYFRPLRLIKTLAIFLCVFFIIHNLAKLLRSSHENSLIIKNDLDISPIKKSHVEHRSYSLDPYYISLPNFVDDEAKKWFYNSTYFKYYSKLCSNNLCEGKGFLFNDAREHLTVDLYFVKNGLYLNDDCGYNYTDEAIQRIYENPNEVDVIYDKAILYPVPDGWAFQHFLDGIGPKLSQTYSLLKLYPDAKVIILEGIRFDRSVKEIWSMLGINESDRLVHYNRKTKLGAHLLINPCRTPATHPRLWQDARQMYWTISGFPHTLNQTKRNNLIYIQRTTSNAMNGRRLILNEEAFIKVLRDYCDKNSLNYVQYDHSKDIGHIRHRIELFHNSKVIIGVHSGALSNMNFAPSGTTVIEIMPYRSDTSSLPMTCSMYKPEDIKACAGYILYIQAKLLNQSYWILPTLVNEQENLNVEINRLEKLMNQIQL